MNLAQYSHVLAYQHATRFEGSQQVVTNGRTGKQTDWNESRTPTGAQLLEALAP